MKPYPTTRPQADRIQLPEPLPHPATDRFLRINQVLEIIPVSRSTWWEGVASGRYPKGIKLSERTTAGFDNRKLTKERRL